MQISMFSSEDHRARASVSQDSERDWMIRVATSCSPMVPLLNDIAPVGWYGRTSPASSPVTEDETLRHFWASSPGSTSSPPPMGGETAGWSQESPKPTASHGECLTLNSSEWTATLAPSPSDGGVCSLSDILEATGDVPQRFYLSAKACRGMLRRAEKRGKQLPPALESALVSVAGSGSASDQARSGGGATRTTSGGAPGAT